MVQQINCPTCKKTVEWNERSEFRPFCSEKCQLIDLGAWANEAYSVPAVTYSEEELDQIQNTHKNHH